jgi:sugar-phosphatase
MAGAIELITDLAAKGYPLAICSSSPMRLIEAVVSKLELKQKFQTLISAENLCFGKPHPEVYINGASALGVSSTECLAIEDSINGVIAAKAARMTTIAIPEPIQFDRPEFAVADSKYHSLIEFHHSITEWLSL